MENLQRMSNHYSGSVTFVCNPDLSCIGGMMSSQRVHVSSSWLFHISKSSITMLLLIIVTELISVGYVTLYSSGKPSLHRPVPKPAREHPMGTVPMQYATPHDQNTVPTPAREHPMGTIPMQYASPHDQNSRNHCDIKGVKSWKNGMVTLLQPRIEANCTALRTGDEREIGTVKKRIQTWVNAESDETFLKTLSNCSHIVEEYSSNFYVSPEEENFPLAYILVVYTNVRQVLRLLKVIYRPHNLYCIHPDAKRPAVVRSFQTVSHCLRNVFVASKLERVYYAHHTIMDAQLNCMQDLMNYNPSRWRYTINLCGRELPLKTNREIVQSLIKLNGSSAIDSGENPNGDRLVYKAVLSHGHVAKTKSKLGPVPYGIKIYKSMNYIAAARPFVSFLLTNNISIALRKYLQDVKVPEEHYYSSMYKLPDVPGGPPKNASIKPLVNSCVWMTSDYARQHQQELCKGKVIHYTCVLSSGDLPTVYRKGVNALRPTFFFNKYFMEWDHVVMDCMEQRIVKQNKLEYEHDCLV